MEERNVRPTRIGIVVSNKMQGTIVVACKQRKQHPVLKKFMNFTKKYAVDDPKGEAGVGDTVEIMETRHISKTKYNRLVGIIEKAK